ncbi:MAG TPA: DUF1801 domain-containing protein [Candidatus Angelobacter sp.]|jgi:uncharacterized protein YdhG (YjbR/CyaY superfamily)|nr:DUF1801 domain-containing protein [Candidatus Angelobacter sp.]
MKKAKSTKRAAATRRKGLTKQTASKQSGPKRSAAKRSAEKTAAPQTVDEYLAAVPEPARSAVDKIRKAIRSVVPADATEVISYGIPAFKHKKVLVWYAAFANHCSLFPTAAVIETFKDELKGFSTSKGTVHFPLEKPMPVALIKKLVKARVARSESKTRNARQGP